MYYKRKMCQYFTTCYLFVSLVAIHFANGASVSEDGTEDRSRCYTMIRYFRTDCCHKCPEIFPAGRCLYFKNVWQCWCGEGNKKHELYTASEANRMFRVCNSRIQNHEGCRKLCPKQFDRGYCDELPGGWQCVCYQNHRVFDAYSLKVAITMQAVCNHEIQNSDGCSALCPEGFVGSCDNHGGVHTCYCTPLEDTSDPPESYTVANAAVVAQQSSFCNSEVQNVEMCKELCPSDFEFAHCVNENARWGCYCSQRNYDFELYNVSEAWGIYRASHGKGRDDCSSLCPDGLKHGNRFALATGILGCGCKGMAHETELYTVRKAYEMNSVCNSGTNGREVANEGCFDLCPQGFIQGKCFHRKDFWECGCSRQTTDADWVNLKDAIVFKRVQKNHKNAERVVRFEAE